ncbi:MAG: restriction endonuclease subunit S [Patescibacteria group bacterium]
MIKQKITIPKGWEVKKLKELLDYERPDKYIVKSTEYQGNFKIPVLTANKSFIRGYTNEEFGICRDLPVIIFDDFTTDSKYVDFPFKVKSSAIKILRSKSEHANLKFLYEVIKSIHFSVGNHKRYYISEYQNIDVIVPTWNEQKKIAEILSKVDEDIEKTEGVIKNIEKLKRGLMRELLTKGIGHKKFKKTKLGEIPEDWEIIELQKFADLIMGQSPSSKSYNQKRNGLPFLQGNADFIVGSKYPKIRQWTTELTKISEAGSILFSVRAPVGEVFMNNTKACIGRGLASLNAKVKDSQEFLYYCLQNLEDRFNKLAQGSTFTAINSDSLKNIKILKPKLIQEQKQIAEILSSVDDKIEINKQIKNKLIQLKKGLMQDLLSGKVRVGI